MAVVSARKSNGLATTSLVSGIVGWALALILACLNWVIVPFFAVATMGAGLILYICTLAMGCISPIAWLVGAITGYLARNQIKSSGEGGAGRASAGFIMSLIGLGITFLLLCIGVVLVVIGTLQIPDLGSF